MMAKDQIKNKRRYYKATKEKGDSTASNSNYKMFIVRFHDDESNAVQNDGPYSEEEKATEILNSYLKRGICSWLVSYNG